MGKRELILWEKKKKKWRGEKGEGRALYCSRVGTSGELPSVHSLVVCHTIIHIICYAKEAPVATT